MDTWKHLMREKHLVVVGGGIIGLATARAIARAEPNIHVRVFEKETEVALHQTGRNSGVIHSGVYYTPNSLKALLCRRGKALLESFAAERDIPFERCGKLIVATDQLELKRPADSS